MPIMAPLLRALCRASKRVAARMQRARARRSGSVRVRGEKICRALSPHALAFADEVVMLALPCLRHAAPFYAVDAPPR